MALGRCLFYLLSQRFVIFVNIDGGSDLRQVIFMGNCFNRPAKSVHAASSSSFSETPRPSQNTSNRTSSSQNTSSSNRVSHLMIKREPSSLGSLKSFSFNDLKNATKNFRSDSFLGEGGFGCVFKGWIDENTLGPTKPGVGLGVAIKKLKLESFQGHKEWLAEVNYLGQLRHENLVKLIGFCSDSENRLLVYEFMTRGSLENHLFRRGVRPISWPKRVNIAIGVARGLSFLHNLENPVIYRDLKASNILLDSDFNSKLSDFGLARDGPTGDNTHVSTKVVGTRGYAAPEYVATGHLTIRSDVYSYGVVLLELLSGRRALDEDLVGVEETLVDWAKPFLIDDNRKVLRIMDTRLEGQYSKKGAQTVAALALQCLHTDPKNRPLMRDVVTTLEQLETTKDAPRTPLSKLHQHGNKHSNYSHKAITTVKT